MIRNLYALIGAVCLIGVAQVSLAVDKPIDATKLVIKRSPSGKGKLVFVSKDPGALFPVINGPNDPVSGAPGGVSITLISPAENVQTVTVPSGAAGPGWTKTTTAGTTTYSYKNTDAPAGPSLVKTLLLKDTKVIKIVMNDTALPMASSHGTIGVRIQTGTLNNCVAFDPTTVVVDTPGRFVATRASGIALVDCTNASLLDPPFCGDNDRTGSEDCDGDDDAECPGECEVDCTCTFCGDGDISVEEECDPPALQGGDPSCNVDCTIAICGDGDVEAGEQCDPPASAGGVAKCQGDCTLSPCGNGTIDIGEECDTSGGCSAGEACTDCCSCIDAQCPDAMEITLNAGTGVSSTATSFDFGSSGGAHDLDHLDQVPLELRLCSSTGPAPACGVAAIGGVSPTTGNCRCANDNRAICDEPFTLDVDNCGGALCACYLRPPEPSSSGNTPTCDLWKLASDVVGTWNVDSGQGQIAIVSYKIRHSGEALTDPCPTCVGDATPNDGVRGGVCEFGDNDGLPCDANAADASFPAPGGGEYSYDCFPAAGKNVSGLGLRLKNIYTTATSSLPAAALPCGIPSVAPRNCPCGFCSEDPTIGCAFNADCAGSGSCSVGGFVFPNECADEICAPTGGDEGVCSAGPTDRFCDGIVRADGAGFIICNGNPDCQPSAIGVAAGNCTLSKLRECFPEPVVASGSPSQTSPVLAAASCAAKGPGPGANSFFGLPGAARDKLATSLSLRCAGNPGSTYPGCP